MVNSEIAFSLILHSGDSLSHAMEAIELAREGNFEEAELAMKKANESLNKAHQIQTDLLHKECSEELLENSSVNILMVHAQDHLSNALNTINYANEFITLYKILFTNNLIKK